MSSLEQKQREYDDMRAIWFVANTLLEVSAERIKHLRDRFEQNQLFYAEISELFGTIKRSAQKRKELDRMVRAGKRSVSIAVTSNSRFYGSINNQIINAFIKHIESHPDRSFMVIGAVGERLMASTQFRKKSVYISFAGDHPTQNEVRHLLDEIEPYADVLIFHPQFVNVFLQEVGILDMNQTGGAVSSGLGDVEYLFEPELPRILKFFETRVRYLLFQRAMLETELARTAARLTAMSRSEERASNVLKHVRMMIRKEQQTLDSQRLLESLAGIVKWKKIPRINL